MRKSEKSEEKFKGNLFLFFFKSLSRSFLQKKGDYDGKSIIILQFLYKYEIILIE